MVAFIDEEIRKAWQAAAVGILRPPRPMPNGAAASIWTCWAASRRSTSCSNTLSVARKTRRKNLVDALLGDEYAEEYARNWTTLWTNSLIGRSGGTERRIADQPRRYAAVPAALRSSEHALRPVVYELIAAKGVNKPGEEDFNGFVNFLAGNLQENAAQATAKTSQIFLGMQVQCTQCHNHPFNDWKQNQFWELNAFFRQTRRCAALSRARRRLASS